MWLKKSQHTVGKLVEIGRISVHLGGFSGWFQTDVDECAEGSEYVNMSVDFLAGLPENDSIGGISGLLKRENEIWRRGIAT